MTGNASEARRDEKGTENYHRRRCHQYGGHRATMPPYRCAACHQELRDRSARLGTVHQLEYRGNSPNVTVEHDCRRYSDRWVDMKPPNIHVNPRSSREGVV
ncbi:PREDICTED: uncharacterized protein LOC105149374 [Acromyrmex echinatior]|uniref:uncharacterized protein LOC105149374 n=1 Tax=Acromyrmex echinatior TaxID=103372 RepID=UPI000580CE33|nr:PREDICTED: uncharacterized protein LOC105149374 [Acromyrmex echinatior]